MRAFLGVLLVLLLPGCTGFAAESGFGSRFVPASCVADVAPARLSEATPVAAHAELLAAAAPVLRAVTYNLHSGLGPRRAFYRSRATVERHLTGIASAIAGAAAPADIIGLNEVDFAARRSGGFDQARFLAHELERLSGARYEIVYGETWRRRLPGFEVRFGNAALVRHPVTHAASCLYDDTRACGDVGPDAGMPSLRASGFFSRMTREARGLIKLTFDFHGQPVDAIVTHLDAFVLAEREAQAAHLLRRFVEPGRTTLVLGDINAVPTAMTYSRAFFAADRTHDILTSGALADARMLYAASNSHADLRSFATYPATAPAWPLDAILGSLDLVPFDVRVIASPHSDHHGLYAEYRMSSDAAIVAQMRAQHDAMRRRQLAQILRCDLVQAGTAQLRWLLEGTEFLSVASAAERRALLRMGPPL